MGIPCVINLISEKCFMSAFQWQWKMVDNYMVTSVLDYEITR